MRCAIVALLAVVLAGSVASAQPADGRQAKDDAGNLMYQDVGFLGIGAQTALVPQPASTVLPMAGENIKQVAGVILNLPARVAGVAKAAFSEEPRDPNGPISVVGVGRVAGEVQRQQIRRLYGYRDHAIRVIFNGVLLKQAKGDPGFRARIGAENTVLIGTIATLIPQKGLPDLIRVARRVLDAGHRAKFVIVGEGKMRTELEALRHELKLDEDVVLTGWITISNSPTASTDRSSIDA